MARLGDVPKLFKSVSPLQFGLRVWRQMSEDNLFTWAAALAYSWLFAIFPFLLALLAVIPYLPQKTRADAQQSIHLLLDRFLPGEAEETLRRNIEGNVNNLLHEHKGLVLYSGLLVALWAASGGMAATMSALDRCYELHHGRSFFRQRVLAVTMTLIVIVLLLAVACLLPVGSVMRDWIVSNHVLSKHHPLLLIFDFLRWLLALMFLFLVLAMVYWKGPSIKHHFNWITPGSVFSVVVWIILGFAFRLYVDKIGERSYDKTYGAVGGVAIML
ncbi:MAG TPA: YihY/virulence factor BrkB family protein, partial [Tepidisphaeraceae bacterium]|nr:YihY/virulence factor BrkB family protein [Tepidisphaeraceae bacterium]